MPSSVTVPALGSSSRGTRCASVLLPLPVCPTMATVVPAGMRRFTLLQRRAGRRSCTRDFVKLDLAPQR